MYDVDKAHWTVNEYLAGLRLVESGSIYGNYKAVNPTSGAYGAYQLVPTYLEYIVTEAGQNPDDIASPTVQDIVAEYWARHHYGALGNWDLVAVAWHKGGTNAAYVPVKFGITGPEVTVENIEEAIPGEAAYILKIISGAAMWREVDSPTVSGCNESDESIPDEPL